MTCAACGRDIDEERGGEAAICCAASVCVACWEADRTCADEAACQNRAAAGVFAEVHGCKGPAA